MFERRDLNKDEGLTNPEFTKYYYDLLLAEKKDRERRLHEKLMKKANEMVKIALECDYSSDGKLDVHEVIMGLYKQLGGRPSKEAIAQARATFESNDVNKDGVLD